MRAIEVTEWQLEQLKHMTLGERLKWVREQLQGVYKKGYSINQVAKHIRDEAGSVITAQGLSAIEMGKTKNPSFRTINALADYYRIPNEVLFDEYYKNPSPFIIGDDSAAAAKQEIPCYITVFANDELFAESYKLTPQQITMLIKRIKLEVSLMQEEQH